MKKLYFIILLFAMSSCVSKKKFQNLEQELKNQKELFANQSEMLEKSRKNTTDSERSRAVSDGEIRLRDAQIVAKEGKIKDLETQLQTLRENNDKMLGQITTWGSTSKADADNINRLIWQIEDLNRQLRKERIYRYGTSYDKEKDNY